ncbi:MAG TPA: sigma-70 family RNA polymerase sigma factor [Thermoanaerobaculia bacterium]|nr:sigma-70 family RNA polymerase sigma factor [Thermoanaerobaculia bacterium]
MRNSGTATPAEERLLSGAESPASSAGPWPEPPEPGTLYLQFGPVLRRMAIGRYGIPAQEADGLVHDVFATYLLNPNGARVMNVRGYLVGGIANAAREYWREKRRDVPLAEVADSAITVENDAMKGLAERLHVAATLARLRSRCRDVLKRYYFDGEPTESIADSMGTTARNVIYMLHVCRGRARKIYEALMQSKSEKA